MENLLPHFFLENQPLNNKTYYKMGGVARFYAEPNSISEIQEALFWSQKNLLPCAVLGSGSNSVYADGEFLGLVISLEKLSAWHWESTEILFAEAGVTNTEISEICMSENRAGASWMYRMPGQLGASVRMNARCYGGEISQIIYQIITINTNGDLKTYSADEVFKGYKSTLLMSKPEIVVGARLRFSLSENPEKLIQHMHECEADRHKKRHFYLPSCGSTFKNNYEVGKPSGQLFDQLGLKGTRVGNAVVSEFHANFVWNFGNASTNDMLTLTSIMRAKAKKELQADLELEVQPIGEFSNDLFTSCGMQKLGPSYCGMDHKKWVGILWYPQSENISYKKKQENIIFPLKIFESPFIEYSQTQNIGVPSIGVEVFQFQSIEKAMKKKDEPFLKWITYSFEPFENNFLYFPQQRESKYTAYFVDELWKFSVSELFLASAINSSHYFEFEMTPRGEWVAIEFDAIRKRTNKNKTLNEKYWSELKFLNLENEKFKDNKNRYTFGMIFTFNQLKKMINPKNPELLLQAALSLGDAKYFLAPYWKHKKYSRDHKGVVIENSTTPNFHQPNRYWKVKLI
ncbi:UDP-N-acetylmuramate dehydrogenase [Fluviispira multicolorata]|uniref:UDP-N-acetylenolpyruvoylglucosamine reductase n=1 Tax=Fluviispira multicolorata TaxID=2654512 RepID=A0A833N4W1_9BACT|nr:UDP-N-acetylmuramate dehydrogenase [Fluviispira multicolorata]KAB8031853.1 UDP-N-acetylmuramate dehydrogenase [Fluviispira multicolorata]